MRMIRVAHNIWTKYGRRITGTVSMLDKGCEVLAYARTVDGNGIKS